MSETNIENDPGYKQHEEIKRLSILEKVMVAASLIMAVNAIYVHFFWEFKP